MDRSKATIKIAWSFSPAANEQDRQRIEQQMAELRELHWADDDRKRAILEKSEELARYFDEQMRPDMERRRQERLLNPNLFTASRSRPAS